MTTTREAVDEIIAAEGEDHSVERASYDASMVNLIKLEMHLKSHPYRQRICKHEQVVHAGFDDEGNTLWACEYCEAILFASDLDSDKAPTMSREDLVSEIRVLRGFIADDSKIIQELKQREEQTSKRLERLEGYQRYVSTMALSCASRLSGAGGEDHKTKNEEMLRVINLLLGVVRGRTIDDISQDMNDIPF